MKSSSVNASTLLSNVNVLDVLVFTLFGFFMAFLSAPFNEFIKIIGTFAFFSALSVLLYAIHASAKRLAKRLEEKQKETDDLESFASHVMRKSDVENFVKDVVDIHLKNKKSIDSYQEFFFRLIGQNGKVYELFVAEIKRVIFEQKEIFERSEKTNSDINRYTLALSSLNEFLQKFVEIRGGESSTFCFVDGGIEKGISGKNEPMFGCGVGISN